MTRAVREVWLLAREHLRAAGVEAAGMEAEVLLRHVLGFTRAELYLAWERPVAEEQWGRFRMLLEERAAGRPVPYITGRREFMGLEFQVDERVLIPRPETEILVEFLLHALAERAAPKVADIGTGSGAIAVSVAVFRPDALILATDFSERALVVAMANARRHRVDERVTFAHGDLLDPVRAHEWTSLDAVVSNPPYVDPDAAAYLPREIREHEPADAVLSPRGGTAFHARLTVEAPAVLDHGGWLAVEVGAGQAEEVVELFERARAYRHTTTVKDLQGIERVVAGERA